METLRSDDTPDWPHPEGKRWGVVKDEGEWLVYAGWLAAVVSPVGVVKRRTAERVQLV
ncbi:hypothetical protein ACFOW6_09055 [Fodinicurvata halophila]|uniref:Uncharacterized protein n=1 Tax=Fodinicurvata halophila TaxID=1419723 RepID=A0ABV8ULH5_9PROT